MNDEVVGVCSGLFGAVFGWCSSDDVISSPLLRILLEIQYGHVLFLPVL